MRRSVGAVLIRAIAAAERSKWEDLLLQHIHAVGLPVPVREHRFHPDRAWRFDICWPPIKIAVEVEGVTWGSGGRHQRPEGMAKDAEKYNAAVLEGWMLLRFTQRQVRSGYAIRTIEAAFRARE